MLKIVFFCFVFLTSQLRLDAEAIPSTTTPPEKLKDIQISIAIIKPQGVNNNVVGKILTEYEEAGLRIAGIKMGTLTPREAEEYYIEEKGKPNYKKLVEDLSSGPIIIVAFEGKKSFETSNKVEKIIELQDSLVKNSTTAFKKDDKVENSNDQVYFFFEPDELSSRF